MSAYTSIDKMTKSNATQIADLLSQLESLNHTITHVTQMLQDLRPFDELNTSCGAPRVTENVKPSVQSCLKMAQHARSNIRGLDTQLKDFTDGGSRCTRSAEATNESCESSISAQEKRDSVSNILIDESQSPWCATQRPWPWPLGKEEYQRYGRQLIMPEIGLQGQLRLKKSSVLVVGVGGLGCPAATYLAGAGVGTLGLVDGDIVEISNLHRQTLHSTGKVGWTKVESAIHSLKAINPLVKYKAHNEHLTPQNAVSIASGYNIILDCTDHPTSRYLVSDVAVLLNIPLVSASALKADGQLAILNNPPAPPGDLEGGPCYRCIFPKPPPPDSVISCGDGGILGPVVGVMGVLQALEALKAIVAQKHAQSQSLHQEDSVTGFPASTGRTSPAGSLLIFSAFSSQPFRSVRLRGRRAGCTGCSAESSITRESLTSGLLDYVQFCGIAPAIDILPPEERVTASAYAAERKQAQAVKSDRNDLLIDVRERNQFELCSMPGSINIPYSDISNWNAREDAAVLDGKLDGKRSVRFICRLGNDSQLAINKIKELGIWAAETDGDCTLAHVEGGWKAWKRDVDEDWPDY